MSGRVTRVGGQQDRRSTSDLLGDLIGVDVVVVVLGEGNGNRSDLLNSKVSPDRSSKLNHDHSPPTSVTNCTHVLEQRQHLRVGRVIRDRERQVRISQNSSNTDQTRTTTGNNADVLPSVLTGLALTIVLIVEASDGGTQRLDTGGRTVLTGGGGDGDGSRARETALDLIIGFRRTLA